MLAGASCIFNLKEQPFKNMKDFFFPSRIVITVQKILLFYIQPQFCLKKDNLFLFKYF